MVGCKNSQWIFFKFLLRSYIDPGQILNEDNEHYGKIYNLFSENTRIRKDWTNLK